MKPRLNLPQPTAKEVSESETGLKEAAAFAANVDLSNQKKLNQYNKLNRDDRREGHIHRITVFGIYFVTACCAIMFFVLVLQYILPKDRRFLDLADEARLQTFLFSRTIGSIVTRFSGRLAKSEKPN